MSFADSLWSVIAWALRLNTTSDLLDTNRTHTSIPYAHTLPAPNTFDYKGYICYVGYAAKNHTDYFG